jgi:hypothetical protein
VDNYALREVRVGPEYDNGDIDRFQLNYLDKRSMRPLPSTRVYIGENLVVETNSLCCFGPEPDLSKPLVGIFGDSVVQGVATDSLVNHIHLPGCSVVNGGVEGAQLHHIVDRFCEVSAQAPMICGAVHSGFHNLIYNETSFMFWEQQFARVKDVPVIAHFRLTADINAEAVERGYEGLYGNGYGPMHHSKDIPTVREFKAALDRKNKLIEKMCGMWDRVLINLDEVLAPKTYADLTVNFFDILHPRPELYRAIGEAVARQLAPHIEKAMNSVPSKAPAAAVVREDPRASRGRTYPLW